MKTLHTIATSGVQGRNALNNLKKATYKEKEELVEKVESLERDTLALEEKKAKVEGSLEESVS